MMLLDEITAANQRLGAAQTSGMPAPVNYACRRGDPDAVIDTLADLELDLEP